MPMMEELTMDAYVWKFARNAEGTQEQIKLMEDKIEATRAGITVQLADTYTLVVGDNFQLFYRSVVQAPDPYGYYIKFFNKT